MTGVDRRGSTFALCVTEKSRCSESPETFSAFPKSLSRAVDLGQTPDSFVPLFVSYGQSYQEINTIKEGDIEKICLCFCVLKNKMLGYERSSYMLYVSVCLRVLLYVYVKSLEVTCIIYDIYVIDTYICMYIKENRSPWLKL